MKMLFILKLIFIFVFLAVDGSQPTVTPSPIPPVRIIVHIQEPEFQIVETGKTVRYHCSGRSQDRVNISLILILMKPFWMILQYLFALIEIGIGAY
jgi:hypothetical protein